MISSMRLKPELMRCEIRASRDVWRNWTDRRSMALEPAVSGLGKSNVFRNSSSKLVGRLLAVRRLVSVLSKPELVAIRVFKLEVLHLIEGH